MVNKKTKLEENRYIILVVAGSVLLCVLVAFLVGRPLYQSVKKTNAELESKQQTLAKLETKLEALRGLDSRKEELEEQNKVVLAAIPTDKDISRLFYQFEKVAESSGVKIESVSEIIALTSGAPTSDTQITEARTFSPVSYKVTATANSYDSLKAALKNFETSLRILSIDSININKDSSDLDIILTINTYKRG